MTKRTRIVSALAAASALTLAACSPQNENPSTESTNADSTAASAKKDADDSNDVKDADSALTFKDAVVRAKADDSKMTAIFGTLVNETDKDITVEGFDSDIDAKSHELHETVDGVMRPMEKPLVIPAGGEHVLEPGGDHFMIMGVQDEVKAGESVDITVSLSNGDDVEIDDIPVREIGAGDENYGGNMEGMGDMSGHDM